MMKINSLTYSKGKNISSLLKCSTTITASVAKNDEPPNFLLAIPEKNYCDIQVAAREYTMLFRVH